MFTVYVHTINTIIINPMKATMDANMVDVFKDIYEKLEGRNCKPKLHVMDNQHLKAIETYIKSGKAAIQPIESYNHHENMTEPAVKTI